MDRYNRKKNKHRITTLKVVISLFVALITYATANVIYAENSQIPLNSPLEKGERGGLKGEFEKDRKIELEKEEIIGVLERPNVIFPIRWKDPDGTNERGYKLQRSFKEEISDFVDMDSMKKGARGHP